LKFKADTHTYTSGGKEYHPVTRILKETGLIDSSWFTEEASARGIIIHELCALLDRGMSLVGALMEHDEDEFIVSRLIAYSTFLKEVQPVWTEIEEPQINKKHLFAGTPDRKGMMFGIETILDIKTGQKIEWHGVQLAGYEMLTMKAEDTKSFSPIALYTLYLGENKYKLHQWRGTEYHEVFKSALNVYRWKMRNGQSIR
jgi:hypothetical protein